MARRFDEHALTFACGEDTLVGVIAASATASSRGVLIVVGGPQYRAGSHRQFVHLARYLAAAGTDCMRFDVRGMGDSSGELRSFEHIHDDIAAAIDAFFAARPALREVVLWGLCDAASAALFYGFQDARVTGLVLLNPWVRTPAGEAGAYLRHYYLQRLLAREFWQKVARGEFRIAASGRDFMAKVVRSVRKSRGAGVASPPTAAVDPSLPLPDRMAACLAQFSGKVLLVLSGNDLTAREFTDAVAASPTWGRLLAGERVSRRDLPQANHTFSSEEWRNVVAEWTREWLQSW